MTTEIGKSLPTYEIIGIAKNSAWYNAKSVNLIGVKVKPTSLSNWNGPWHEGKLTIQESTNDLKEGEVIFVLGAKLKKISHE